MFGGRNHKYSFIFLYWYNQWRNIWNARFVGAIILI